MADTIRVTLRVWRQNGPSDAGRFEDHPNVEISKIGRAHV